MIPLDQQIEFKIGNTYPYKIRSFNNKIKKTKIHILGIFDHMIVYKYWTTPYIGWRYNIESEGILSLKIQKANL